MTRLGAGALWAALVCGCFSEAEVVGTGTTGGETGTTDVGSTDPTRADTGSAEASVGDTEPGPGETGIDDTGSNDCTCVPAAPDDWHGPFAVVESGGDTPECPGSHPDKEMDLYAGLEAPDAQCTCACGGIQGSCPGGVLHYYYGPCMTMVEGAPSMQVTDGECFGLDLILIEEGANIGVELDPSPDASCPAVRQGVDVPEASWMLHLAVCGGADVSSCDGGAPCVPSNTPACIVAYDELDCPLGYPSRIVRYRSMDDGRDCSCECVAEAECSGHLGIHAAGPCNDEVYGGSCPHLADHGAARLTTTIAGACEPASVPSGTATPDNPVTICCR
jgi:hypothetical protein